MTNPDPDHCWRRVRDHGQPPPLTLILRRISADGNGSRKCTRDQLAAMTVVRTSVAVES